MPGDVGEPIAESLELSTLDFAEVIDDVWALLAPSCARLSVRG